MFTRSIVSSVTCPHCWIEFPPTQVRFVAEHAALIGDPVLGEGAQLRFLPSRFDARGRAIDPFGVTCSRVACVRCHLEIPSAALELSQTIVSIVGAPSSGKSVMLAAASFSLRSGLVVDGLDFIDADPSLNDLTIELESALFRSSTPDSPAMIAKTDLAGRLYRSFRIGDATWTAPKPQLFMIGRSRRRHLLCMYDNAGEHFLPGGDGTHEPVTRHLAVSRAIVFVVDPTQDQRVTERLGGRDAVRAAGGAASVDQRQDLILIEVANRLRRLRGISAKSGLPFRIVLALSKADIWGSIADAPVGASAGRASGGSPSTSSIAMPSIGVLEAAQENCESFLARHMPELLATARALDPDLRIVPFSGLGRSPTSVAEGTRLAICPRDVKPFWPAAPLVVALAEAEPHLFPEYSIA
jgi:hypothetical protein